MLFADVDVEAASVLLRSVEDTGYQPGEAIYQQGEEAAALFSVRRGVIKLSLVSPEGNLRIVRLIGPGAAIGLEGLLDQPYQHKAEPMTATDICRLPIATVRRLSSEQPQLYERLMLQWQEQINRADTHLLELSTGPIRDRIFHLLRIMHTLCAIGGTEFLLPDNRDCAALVAAREESVSRVIAEFKRTGLLKKDVAGKWLLASDVFAGAYQA